MKGKLETDTKKTGNCNTKTEMRKRDFFPGHFI